MPLFKKHIALFDDSHNEMLSYEDEEFFEFKDILLKNNFFLKQCEKPVLFEDDLTDVDIMVIGNPINEYFTKVEIELILSYVRSGGSLLIIGEFGGDFVQKTNLNDLSKNFGILFENTITKQNNSVPSDNINLIYSFNKHKITHNVSNLMIGGACTLKITDPALPLCFAPKDSWIELYNDGLKDWKKEKTDKELIVSACSLFGQGKVFAIGDIDLFSNNEKFGIHEMDNRKFVINIINWLLESVKSEEVTNWVLDQIGAHREDIKKINYQMANLIESVMMMEKRINKLEDTLESVQDKIKANGITQTAKDDKKRAQKEKETSYT